MKTLYKFLTEDEPLPVVLDDDVDANEENSVDQTNGEAMTLAEDRVVNVNINMPENETSLFIPAESNEEETAPVQPDEIADSDQVLKYAIKQAKQARILANRMRSIGPGNENLLSPIKHILIGLTDSVLHVGNLLGTVAIHGLRDFKNSELTDYINSNEVLTSAIFKLPLQRIDSANVPVPQGMKGTYASASTAILNYLSYVEMPRLIKSILSISQQVEKSVKSKSSMSYLDTDVSELKLDEIEKRYDDESKLFVNNDFYNFDEVEFKKVFTSMSDFKSVISSISSMDRYFREVSGVDATVSKIETIFKKLVNAEPNLSPDELTKLADVVEQFARCITGYATVINDLNRVQHNLSIILVRFKEFVYD